MAVAAITAALAALASLAGKASKDAADAEAQKRARHLFKQQQIAGILQNRAAMSGADTARSTLAGNEQEFLRQLVAQRRDTSGDLVPFVQGLSGVAQGVASDIGNAKPATTVQGPMSRETLKPVFEQYGNAPDEDEQSFLMRLARSRGV